jgi:hypothetical protein
MEEAPTKEIGAARLTAAASSGRRRCGVRKGRGGDAGGAGAQGEGAFIGGEGREGGA